MRTRPRAFGANPCLFTLFNLLLSTPRLTYDRKLGTISKKRRRCGRRMKGGIGSIRSLYEPQVEQLGVRLEQRGEALWGRADNCIARSQVWVRPLGDAGVITSHSMLVKTDTPFVEQSLPGLCIGALSADSLMLCPIARPHGVDPTCNVAVFGQQEGLTDCWLKAGSRQNATSIMLLPQWFDHFDAEIRKARPNGRARRIVRQRARSIHCRVHTAHQSAIRHGHGRRTRARAAHHARDPGGHRMARGAQPGGAGRGLPRTGEPGACDDEDGGAQPGRRSIARRHCARPFHQPQQTVPGIQARDGRKPWLVRSKAQDGAGEQPAGHTPAIHHRGSPSRWLHAPSKFRRGVRTHIRQQPNRMAKRAWPRMSEAPHSGGAALQPNKPSSPSQTRRRRRSGAERN